MAVTTSDRKTIHWLSLLLILAVLGFLAWYFDLFISDAVVVSTVLL